MKKNPYIKVNPIIERSILQKKKQFIKDPEIDCIISIIDNKLTKIKLSRLLLRNEWKKNKCSDFSIANAALYNQCIDIANFSMMLADKLSKKVRGFVKDT